MSSVRRIWPARLMGAFALANTRGGAVGLIESGSVRELIIAASVPTAAVQAGETLRGSRDRFAFGGTETSGREHYLYVGVDEEVISATWKTFKVHFRYTEEYSWTAPYVKRQVPMVMNLVNDPHEEIDLMDAELTYAWVIGLASAPLIQLAQSAAEYPHIRPGADFQGYN